MLTARATIDSKLLVLASSFTKIATLNRRFESHKPERSLRTSGSFDGQPSAGMIGTGVHGAAHVGFSVRSA